MVMKLTPIKDYRENITIQGFFLCVEKHTRITKVGDYYLDLLLQDATGRIPCKIWENVEHFGKEFSVGDPVAAKGVVESYHNILQLNCAHIALATAEKYGSYGFNESDLIPTIDEDPKALWDDLRKLVNATKSKPMKGILKQVLKSWKDTILVLPASVNHHHTERGGFLKHMVSTAQLADMIAGHYDFIDRDLLVTGTILHDMGKVRGMTTSLNTDYTEAGQLVGHPALGRDILLEAVEKVSKVPDKLVAQLEHMILSHQGSPVNGSVVPPKFPEALLLHYIDSIDGKLDQMLREMAASHEEGPFTDNRNTFRTKLWKGYRS